MEVGQSPIGGCSAIEKKTTQAETAKNFNPGAQKRNNYIGI
jgi:hypothetical protein